MRTTLRAACASGSAVGALLALGVPASVQAAAGARPIERTWEFCGDTRCVTLKRLKPPLPPATTTAADTEPPQVEALPSRGALEKCTSRGTLSYGARVLYDFVDKHGWRFFDADLTEVGTQKTGHRRQFD